MAEQVLEQAARKVQHPSGAVRTVLFDLDGTLLDTAPDLAYALNVLLQEQGREPLPYEQIRPVVSHGGRALIRLGFQLEPDHPDFEPLRQRLLAVYRDNIAQATRPFPGMEQLLDALEARGMNWGIVTNKPAWLTEPLLEALDLTRRAACVISGDTTANSKPHPEPMLLACRLAGSHHRQCIYLGDARRDIQAGQAAGMRTLVALFGYLGADDRPEDWGADAMIHDPIELLTWLERWNQP